MSWMDNYQITEEDDGTFSCYYTVEGLDPIGEALSYMEAKEICKDHRDWW